MRASGAARGWPTRAGDDKHETTGPGDREWLADGPASIPLGLWPLVASAARERGGQALAGLIVEPQLGIDPGKGTSWPIYWVSLRTRHECKVWTIVVSPADAVVRWASDRLFLGEPQIIHVVGRDHVQPVLELDRALANPAWAALTAALHARGPHAEASAETLFQACATLPADARRCYLRLVCAGLEQDVMNAIKPSMPKR